MLFLKALLLKGSADDCVVFAPFFKLGGGTLFWNGEELSFKACT